MEEALKNGKNEDKVYIAEVIKEGSTIGGQDFNDRARALQVEAKDIYNKTKEQANTLVKEAHDKFGDLAEIAKEKGATFSVEAKERYTEAKEKTSEFVEGASENLGKVSETAKRFIKNVFDKE